MDVVNIKVFANGYYCNQWPRFQLIHGSKVVWDGEIKGSCVIEVDLLCADVDSLTLKHLDKKFGEDGIWDTLPDGSADRYVEITDIKLDDVSIGEKLLSALVFCTEWSDVQRLHQDPGFIEQYSEFCSNGRMSFNGSIKLEFETPIYNWLIPKKFKVEKTETAYFSNYSLRWHYEKDLELIKEIKELMKLDENTDIKRTQD